MKTYFTFKLLVITTFVILFQVSSYEYALAQGTSHLISMKWVRVHEKSGCIDALGGMKLPASVHCPCGLSPIGNKAILIKMRRTNLHKEDILFDAWFDPSQSSRVRNYFSNAIAAKTLVGTSVKSLRGGNEIYGVTNYWQFVSHSFVNKGVVTYYFFYSPKMPDFLPGDHMDDKMAQLIHSPRSPVKSVKEALTLRVYFYAER